MSREVLHGEIAEQPRVLAALLEREQGRIAELAKLARQRDPALVVLAGRGTSDHAALYLRYLLETLVGLPVSLAAPSVFTLYQATPRLGKALVIGISQSGQSEDIRAVVEEGRRQGALTAALTNDPLSPLARSADWVLNCHAGRERSIPATKTYTAELGLAALLTALLADDPVLLEALKLIPAEMQSVLEREAEIAAAASALAGIERCLVLGRGYNYATAAELALKLKEMSQVSAEPYAVPDFLHGPIVMIEEGYPVLLVAPGDRTLPNLREAAEAVRARGATLVALTDDPDLLAMVGAGALLPRCTHEALSPLPYAVAGQLFAYHLALASGMDPSAPRGLGKVTITR